MKPAGRISDQAHCPADAHGCPSCAHSVVGPLLDGASNVLINNEGAARVGDAGVHSACCGANRWVASAGAERVLINGLPAHRLGDDSTHCGGSGTLVTGSSNVLIGGPKGTGTGTTASDDMELECLRVRIRFADNDQPARDEPYDILNADGNVVRTGQTDEEGRIAEDELKRGIYHVRLKNGWVIKRG